MARTTVAGLRQSIADAALATFIARGYRGTTVAEVAGRAGVAVGTVYLRAANKDALFELAFRRAFDDDGDTEARFEGSGDVRWPDRLWRRLTVDDPLGALREAAERRRSPEPARELDAVLTGLFQWQSRHWKAIKLIERCATEWPELHLLFYLQFRREALALATRYFERRIQSGQFAPIADVSVAVRLVMEVFAFFTMHRHHAPDAADIADRPLEPTIIPLLVRALVRGAPPR